MILPHLNALLCQVKSSGVKQCKITKGAVWAGLTRKGLSFIFTMKYREHNNPHSSAIIKKTLCKVLTMMH